MSTSATAILLGDIHYEEIAQRLKDRFALESVRVLVRDYEQDGYARLLFEDPDGKTKQRQMYVYRDGAIFDSMDVFDGTRTFISLGSGGSAPELLSSLAEVYGGYVRFYDEGEHEDYWRFIRGDEALMADLPPETKLKLELSDSLSVKDAVLLSRIAEDEAQLESVIDAFLRYRNRKNELSPQPANPSIR